MTLSVAAKNRLYNWKFASAVLEVDDSTTEEERELIHALSRMLRNSGWFDGDLSTVVRAALKPILGDNP